MKRVLGLAATLLLALTVTSCGSSTGPAGTWGEGYSTDHLPYLELSLAAEQGEDQAGYLAGSDGCNRLAGQWMMVGDEMTFPQFSATQKSCEDTDTWLGQAAGAVLDGDVLTVVDASGATLGTLDRRN